MKRDKVEKIAAEMRAKLAKDNRLGVLLSNADAQVVLRALEELSGTMPTWEVSDPKGSVAVVAQTTASGAVVATQVVQS